MSSKIWKLPGYSIAEHRTGSFSCQDHISYKAKVMTKLSLCFLTEHHAIKMYLENGGKAPRILDLGTRQR